MSTFTLQRVDRDHVDLVCTCGAEPVRLLASDRLAITQAKRDHRCRRHPAPQAPEWRPGGGEAA